MSKTLFFIVFALFCPRKGDSQNKSDTISCKLLYNKFDYFNYSLRFDLGDEISFTPNFLLIRDGKLIDTGFVYSDSLNYKLFNDSNHVLLFSKRFLRYLRKHSHPARNNYNGFHFYLFDVIIVISDENEIRLTNWPAPASKSTSEYKEIVIIKIEKIIKITPINSKKLQRTIWKE